MLRNSPSTLQKLEDLCKAARYEIRYEKGNFRSGSCVLEEHRVVVINKFSSLDNKIAFLAEFLSTTDIEEEELSDDLKALYKKLKKEKA